MVRAEDRTKDVGMAREVGRPSSMGGAEDTHHDRECIKLRDSIDRTEREIVRITLVAEKEKRDYTAIHSRIKALKDQLYILAAHPVMDDPDSPEEIRRCQSEGDLTFLALHAGGSTPPVSVSPFQRTPASSMCALATRSHTHDAENKSPNISPNVSPITDMSKMQAREVSKHEALLAVKQDELARVQLRAKDDSLRYSALRAREEVLRDAVQNETNRRLRANQDIVRGIAKKEKEIQRLTLVAEKDKRVGMSVRDQITSQRKMLEVFAKTLSDKKPKLERIINSCNDIVVPAPASASPSPNTSTCTTLTPPSPLSLTPISPHNAPFASPSSHKTAPLSPLQEEMNKLIKVSSHKDGELSRVSAIADHEASRVAVLKEKSEEVKMAIADELQSLDEQIDVILRQFRTRQDAIKKVAARADAERAKSCKMQEELDALAKSCGEEKISGIQIKKSEYIPDKAYFSEFKELTELVPVSEIATHPPSSSNDKTGLQLDVDPASLIQSPRVKQISFTSSQDMLALKIRDITTLQQQIARMDEELVRVKNLKEGEVVRRRLLAEKLRDMKEEVEYYRYVKANQDREVSRTF